MENCNWIIRNTSKLQYHTNLGALLQPITDDIKDLKWLISDLDFMSDDADKIPINFDSNWFLLTNEEFDRLINSNTQIIWGAFSAIPENSEIKISEEILPYAEGNELIWKNDNFQVPKSVIEIIAWDSSYTIVKSKDKLISKKFKNYFDEAIELEKYKWKN